MLGPWCLMGSWVLKHYFSLLVWHDNWASLFLVVLRCLYYCLLSSIVIVFWFLQSYVRWVTMPWEFCNWVSKCFTCSILPCKYDLHARINTSHGSTWTVVGTNKTWPNAILSFLLHAQKRPAWVMAPRRHGRNRWKAWVVDVATKWTHMNEPLKIRTKRGRKEAGVGG